MSSDCDYDIALSFASEDKKYAMKLAECLDKKKVTYFLYESQREQASLWGKNLYDELHTIYSEKSKYCVIFVSRAYAEKEWTKHERQAAQAKALREKGKEYILPIQIDNTNLPGLPATIASVKIERGVEYIAGLLLQKLQTIQRISTGKPLDPAPEANTASDKISYKGTYKNRRTNPDLLYYLKLKLRAEISRASLESIMLVITDHETALANHKKSYPFQALADEISKCYKMRCRDWLEHYSTYNGDLDQTKQSIRIVCEKMHEHFSSKIDRMTEKQYRQYRERCNDIIEKQLSELIKLSHKSLPSGWDL